MRAHIVAGYSIVHGCTIFLRCLESSSMSDKDHRVGGCLVDNPMLLITWNCRMKRWSKRANTLNTHSFKRAKTNSKSPFFFNSSVQIQLHDFIIIFCWIVCVESATGTKVQWIPGKRAFREIYSRKNRTTAATTTMQNCIKSNFHFQSVFGRGCFCEQMTFREMKSWVLFQFVSTKFTPTFIIGLIIDHFYLVITHLWVKQRAGVPLSEIIQGRQSENRDIAITL